MTTPDEALSHKLTLDQRSALLTAYRHTHGQIAVVVTPSGSNEAHAVVSDLSKKAVFEVVSVEDYPDGAEEGSRLHIFGITARGKRVARCLPECSGKPLETLWIRIAPNDGVEGEPHWIKVEDFDIVALENCKMMTDQFYMLQPHIPQGWRPVQMERVKPEGVE